MLEGVLAWFINTYIGEWFDNVNTDQLSIAYGEGEVELEGLPLKVQPFKRLGLPFEVRAGYAGKLKFTLRLRNGPCLIHIDELFIICGPRTDFHYDQKYEEEKEDELKQRLLEDLENKFKFADLPKVDTTYYPSYSSFLSFSTSLFTNFTENIQLSVNNVHIRYEDSTICPSNPVCMGFRIKHLAIQSVDEHNETTGVTTGKMKRKQVDLIECSSYWDTDPTLVKDLDRNQIVHLMRQMMDPSYCRNLLSPVNGKAIISQNCTDKPLKSKSCPRFKVDLQFEEICINLNIVQYQQLLTTVDEWNRRVQLIKNCKYRPPSPMAITGPKPWWIYAINVNMEQFRDRKLRRNWSFVLRRCQQIKKYCDVYFATIAQPEDVSREMKSIREQVENELSFDELQGLRDIVYHRYKCFFLTAQPTATPGWTYLQSWMPYFWGVNAGSNGNSECRDDGTSPTSDQINKSFSSTFNEDELIDSLNTVLDDSKFQRDALFTQVNLSLDRASFVLVADPDVLRSSPIHRPLNPKLRQIMEFELTKPFVTMETLPRTCSQRVRAKFSRLTLKDKGINSTSSFKDLIYSQVYHKVSTTSSPNMNDNQISPDSSLFELIYETTFARNFVHKKLFVKTEPLVVVYSKSVADVLQRFFSSKSFNHKEESSILTSATRKQYEILKNQTKVNIQNAVDELMKEDGNAIKIDLIKWDFDLDISAPQILIPENVSLRNTPVVIVDLGRVVFKNRNLSYLREGSEEEDIFVTPPSSPDEMTSGCDDDSTSEEKFDKEQSDQKRKHSSEKVRQPSDFFDPKTIYQTFTVEIKSMQLLVGQGKDNWNYALQKGWGPLHVLNRFTMKFELQRRMTNFSPDLPRVVLTGSLSELSIFLNESKLGSLTRFIKSLNESSQTDLFDEPIIISSGDTSPQEGASNCRKIIFLAEFNIQKTLIALQSNGENLVELQVYGVQAKLEKALTAYCVSLTVTSLLMIDAHQKLGKEYEILLASHENLSIDTTRGTFDDNYKRMRSYSAVLTNLPENIVPSDALISIKMDYDEWTKKQAIDIVFNHFDVIANQETLVEIIGFYRRVYPSSNGAAHRVPPINLNGVGGSFPRSPGTKQTNQTREVTCDFKQLNILLLRSSKRSESVSDKRLATLTLKGAKIKSLFSQDANIVGSLKSLVITNMCDSSSCEGFTEILKIGPDQPNSCHQNHPEAVDFSIKRTFSENLLDANFKLVSLYYLHSPHLLKELASCAKEFKTYMSMLAEKIKTAAAEVAIELVMTPSKDMTGRERKISSNSSLNGPTSSRRQMTYIKTMRLQAEVDNPLIILPSSPGALKALKRYLWGQHNRSSSNLNIFETLAFGLEMKNGSVRLMDDYFSETPLLEMNNKELYLFHTSKGSEHKGNLRTVISSDYFNTCSDGWEPFLEPWGVTLSWNLKTERFNQDGIFHKLSGENATKKMTIKLDSSEVLNFNLTNSLLDLYRRLKTRYEEVIIETGDPEPVHNYMNLMVDPLKSSFFDDIKNKSLRIDGHNTMELAVVFHLQGIGFSLVNHMHEELVYVTLTTVIIDYLKTDFKHSVNCSIKEMQIDNQLSDFQKECALYPMDIDPDDPMNGQPALSIFFHKKIVPDVIHHIIPDFQIKMKDVVLNIEELLLLKLYQFFGYPWEPNRSVALSTVGSAAARELGRIAIASASMVYMALFEIVIRRIRLSVYTNNFLPQDLVRLKERAGLKLISFEDAKVQLQPFRMEKSLGTIHSFLQSIHDHYKKQLTKQAALILGSVDFLGNPIGLIKDVREGVSGAIMDGNIGGLVTNITHGLSNSSAKFLSSLSNSLEATTVDARHQAIRRQIHTGSARNPFSTGLKGLGVGMVGGFTSIFTQTIDGAYSDGFEGLVAGFGKGLLGAVTKPTVGVLDFATGTASALRETVRKISHNPHRSRIRPPRVCVGPNSLLPPYDEEQSGGQEFFYQSSKISDRDPRERFECYEKVQANIACIITNQRVRFLVWNKESRKHGSIFLSLPLFDIIKCSTNQERVTRELTIPYLVIEAYKEILVTEDDCSSNDFPSFGPSSEFATMKRVRKRDSNQIQCSSDKMALRICQLINLSKATFERRNQLTV